MMDSNRRRLLGFAGGSAALSVFPAQGQEKFPSKPIEVVTHSGVGGGTDITARMMMVHAPGVFKTEFVVVNRTGGSGAAALDYMLERPRTATPSRSSRRRTCSPSCAARANTSTRTSCPSRAPPRTRSS